jgi:hypothetical protein
MRNDVRLMQARGPPKSLGQLSGGQCRSPAADEQILPSSEETGEPLSSLGE